MTTQLRPWSAATILGWLVLALCAPFTPSAHAASPTTESTVSDVTEQPLPGREVVRSTKRAFRVPTADSRWADLTMFGHELFRDADQRFTPIEDGPVGPDYTLGPGDNLMVFISSLEDTSVSLTVDREGKVFLPRVGTTFLWGLSFADAEALIKGRLATVLRNARVQVSMGRLRSIDVFVLGAVKKPGKVSLSGLSTVFNALSAGGGPDSLGGLRDITVLRGNRPVARLDLYAFLLRGDRAGDVRLQSGDVVFVGLAKAHVGIQGAVVRPGVYETGDSLSLRALLELAGGASPFADLTRIQVERVDANGGFRLQDLPLDHGHGIDPDSLQLSNYDLVTVFGLNERIRNVVTLDGFVRHPGSYELTDGMRLSQLIGRDRMLPEADVDQAELRRVDATSFKVEVQTFSIRDVWAGQGDLPLRALDAVTVFSTARLPRSVTLEGEVSRPGTYTLSPNERLSDVLQRAGWVTEQGYLPAAVMTRKSAARREQEFLDEFVQRQRVSLAEQRAQLAESGDSLAAGQILQAETSLTSLLSHQNDPGRVVLDLDEKKKWVGAARDPVLEDGDHLFVPLRPATVAVLGSVMNPGTMMARNSASFADYVRMAGGFANEADRSRAYVIKANGEAVPRKAASRIGPGDAIVVPPRVYSNNSIGRSLTGGVRTFAEIATAAALVIAATR